MFEAADLTALSAALERSEDELLAELGSFGADVFPRDASAKGRRLLNNIVANTRSAICSDVRLRLLVEDGASELEIAAAVADLISSASGHLPLATVSVLIGRRKLLDICKSEWN